MIEYQKSLDRLKHDNYKRNNREQLRRKDIELLQQLIDGIKQQRLWATKGVKSNEMFIEKYHLTPIVIDEKLEYFIKKGKMKVIE